MAAALSLSNNFNHSHFFQRSVLLNVQYWRDFVSDQAADASTLEREWEVIVKAAAFALELVDAWPVVYDLLIKFTPYMERRGHWHIWQPLLERAIRAAQTRTDTTCQTTLTALLARLLFYQSRFKESVSCYRRAIHLARQVGDPFTEARSCSNLGYYYTEHGQWWRAELLCCHALRLFEQLDSNHGRAHTENHLGILYTRQGFWDQAAAHLERACALWQTRGDQHGLMRGLINLSVLYLDMEKYDKMLAILNEALQLARLTGEETEIGRIYLNMGIAYEQSGELAQAEALTWQAEAIFRRCSHSSALIRVWNNLGIIYLRQQKWSTAQEYLGLALVTARNLKLAYDELDALEGLVEYKLTRDNPQQAIAYLEDLARLTMPYPRIRHRRRLQALLSRYRHSLPEFPPDRLRQMGLLDD